MRIDAIELYHVSMPLVSPWRTAYGEDHVIESIFVRMHSGDAYGWGEVSPLPAPCYSPEWAGGVFALVERHLAPLVCGSTITSGEELQSRLAHFKGNSFAKAALDTAWWDLSARSQGQPLYRLLGATRSVVSVGADFGVMDQLGDLIESIGRAFDQGFPRVKLKFRPGWDVDMLRAVRQEFPTQKIHVDCNAGYRFEDLDLFCRLDDFNLEMIEQPLAYDDLIDHARLQAEIRTPVCLDESINSVERAEKAVDLEACRYVNVKPGRVGGLTPAVAIHDLCHDTGIPCWVGGMLESAVGARHCLALAALDNFTYPADIFPSRRFYERDLAMPELELSQAEDGTPAIVNQDRPGIGTEPDLERLQSQCLAKKTITAK